MCHKRLRQREDEIVSNALKPFMTMNITMNIGGMPAEAAMEMFKVMAPHVNTVMGELFKDICTIKVTIDANRVETGQKQEPK